LSAYSKPPLNNLPFSFSTGGYSSPDFDDLRFRFGLRPSYEQTANLQAAINVIGRDYLKECPKIIVGYSQHGIQTLNLPCIYGGIRDLGSFLNVNPPNVDLGSYIYAESRFYDLISYIRPEVVGYKDLKIALRGDHMLKKLRLMFCLLYVVGVGKIMLICRDI
jgi:hypothetical protein